MSLVKFLVSPAGRVTRIIAGAILASLGLVTGSTAGIVMLVLGIIPLVTGLFDVCLFAPLFGLSFSGEKARKKARVH